MNEFRLDEKQIRTNVSVCQWFLCMCFWFSRYFWWRKEIGHWFFCSMLLSMHCTFNRLWKKAKTRLYLVFSFLFDSFFPGIIHRLMRTACKRWANVYAKGDCMSFFHSACSFSMLLCSMKNPVCVLIKSSHCHL